MNIRLSSHTEALLKEQLASGGFASADEVIERALETLARSKSVVSDSDARAKAVDDILELRKGVTLGGLRIKDLIHEGHKI